jgi:hypothetical protein
MHNPAIRQISKEINSINIKFINLFLDVIE